MVAKIHIVDDDRPIREAMVEYLDISGFDVSSSDSAEAAIKHLHRQTADIVITDITMPGMSGLELTGVIKEISETDVIVMTGYSGEYSYEEAVGLGANDFVFKPIRFEELILRIKRVLKERKLKKDRESMTEELKKLAITDALTGLFNSRHFFNQLEKEIERHSRYRHPLSLLLLDVDHFKSYNDTYGHVEGDTVLSGLGRVINSCLRTMDTGYRYGGEEFTVILPETNIVEASKVAERIQALLKKSALSKTDEREITISIGVTEFKQDETSIDLIKRTDRAMYISKSDGRNRITTLTPS